MSLPAIPLIDIEGYVYLLVAMIVTNLVPPLPSEVTIPFAAALFDRHHLHLPWAILAATAGLVIGTVPFYWLGRLTGEARFKRFVAGRGRWLLIKATDVDRSGHWFRRHGGLLVIVGRFIPGMRSMISLPAGFHRMPVGRFLIFTTLGSAIWACALVLAGHWLSHALPGVTALTVGLVVLGVGVVFYVGRLIQVLRQ